MQSRMIQYMNQWFLSLQKGIKTIKYWNYRLDENGIQLANRLFECIYQLLSLPGFLSGLFSVGSSSKSKLDRKYDSKESHCIIVLSKHFPRLNHLVETWLITFLTSLFLKLNINSLSCFFKFFFALLQKLWYVSW